MPRARPISPMQPEPPRRARPQERQEPAQQLQEGRQQPAQRGPERARQRLEPQVLPPERGREAARLSPPNRPVGQPGQVESASAPRPSWLCRATKSAPPLRKQLLAYCRLLIRVMRVQD